MALLDNYFTNLQCTTGAEKFVLVRDDAHGVSPESSPSGRRRRIIRTSSGSNKPSPKFEDEVLLDLKPPSQPLRSESKDDLHTMKKIRRHQRVKEKEDKLNRRFQSLFGAEIASKVGTSQSQQKALSSLAAPKFPTRQESGDDLATLRSSNEQLMNRLSDPSTANEKLELTDLLEKVTGVLSSSDGQLVVPPLARCGSPTEIQPNAIMSPKSQRWIADRRALPEA